MHNYLRFVVISVALCGLQACSTLGLAVPQTFNAKLASGYITVTGVRNATADLLVAKIITKPDAQNIQNQADVARAGLDIASDLQLANKPEATARLDATLQVLKSLQVYLTLRSTK